MKTNNIVASKITPLSDAAASLRITKADGVTDVASFNTSTGVATFTNTITGNVSGSAGSAAGIAANTNVNVSTGYGYQINSSNMLHRGTGSMTGNVFVGDGGSVLSHTSSQTGWYNVMVGLGGTAGSMTTGFYNVGLGSSIMGGLTTGSSNVAIGHWSMPYSNGDGNVAVGANTISGAGSGYSNVIVGSGAGMSVGEGFRNVCVGFSAGSTLSTGSNNVCIGAEAHTSTNADTNSIVIGSTLNGTGTNTVAIGNASITAIKGQVGFTTYSDARLKNSIEDNSIGLDFIMALRPRRFKLNGHGPEAKMLDGFVAQEVIQTMTELGVDFSGINTPIVKNDFYGITYDKFVVPLVNAVKALKKEIDELKNTGVLTHADHQHHRPS